MTAQVGSGFTAVAKDYQIFESIKLAPRALQLRDMFIVGCTACVFVYDYKFLLLYIFEHYREAARRKEPLLNQPIMACCA